MPLVLKLAKPNINALENKDPGNFSLYIDQIQDNVLIKENVRDTISLANGAAKDIIHGLKYPPLCFVFVEITSGVFRRIVGNTFANVAFNVDINRLRISNASGGTKVFKYYIFLDQLP